MAVETLPVIPDLSADDARRLTDRIKVGVEAVWQLVEEAYTRRAWTALGYVSWDDYCTREFGTARLRLPREDRQEVVGSLRDAGLSLRAIAAATGISRPTILKDVRQREQVVNSLPPAPPAPAPDDLFAADDDPDEDVEADSFFAGLGATPAVDAELTRAREREHDGHTVPLAEAVDRSRESAPAPAPESRRVTGIDGKSYKAAAQAPAQPRRQPLAYAAEKAGWDFRKATERLVRILEDDRLSANKDQVAAHLAGHLSYAVEVCKDLLDRFNHQQGDN